MVAVEGSKRLALSKEMLLGSVPDVYTTGDNDPELEPKSYYRHDLYCDACGSFDLEPWIAPDNHASLESRQKRIGKAALLACPLVLVPAWTALGFVLPALLPFLLVSGISLMWVLGTIIRQTLWGWKLPLAGRWRWFKATLPWLAVAVVAQLLADELGTSPWRVAVAGLALISALLVWHALLGRAIHWVGLRCRACGATYAYGTPFFSNLEANPRALTVNDVPRPLGSSFFEVGRSVETPEEDGRSAGSSRLPP